MRAFTRALELWGTNIRDPKRDDKSPPALEDKLAILYMLQEGGLDWGRWIKDYAGDGASKWCGAFAAACYKDIVRRDVRYHHFASTPRLFDYGRANKGRMVPLVSDTLPGDIITVGDGDYGSHIVIAGPWDKAKHALVGVSGNYHGRFPDGSWGEGVVMNIFERGEIKGIYRPIKEDLL